MYVSTNDAYRTAGITSTEIDLDNVKEFILDAEAEVDRVTNTTYWAVEENGTATSGTSSTLTDSSLQMVVNEYTDEYIWIFSGTGSGQIRQISSNTETQITITSNWDTTPDNTSQYRVIHTSHSPYIQSEYHDANGTKILFLLRYPLVLLETVTTDSTSVTPSYVLTWPQTGKLQLGDSAEVSHWSAKNNQNTELTYWYGVYPIPREIKRLTVVKTAMKMLRAQMGGTHNIPSTYQLPEASVTIGQAYVNIRGTYDVLEKEHNELLKSIIKYHVFA